MLLLSRARDLPAASLKHLVKLVLLLCFKEFIFSLLKIERFPATFAAKNRALLQCFALPGNLPTGFFYMAPSISLIYSILQYCLKSAESINRSVKMCHLRLNDNE